MENIQPQSGKFRAGPYLPTGKSFFILLLISVCFLGFMSTRETRTTKLDPLVQFIDPEEMVQGELYYFADHGNGMSIVQFASLDNKGNISTTFSITPSQSLFSRAGLWGTVSDAGNIREATQAEITHLHQCIIADEYVHP